MKAIWNDTVLAESDATLEIEGSIYFPPDSVKSEYLQPTDTTTTCPWKGLARYYTIKVGDQSNREAAWSYPEPKEKASHFKGYVAFWRGVEITA